MSLLVFAAITARPGAESDLKASLLELVAQVRTEAACQLYELYESTEQPLRFIMHERWDDEAGLQAHNRMPHRGTSKETIRETSVFRRTTGCRTWLLLAQKPKIGWPNLSS